MECHGASSLQEVLTSKQIHHILNQAVGNDWELVGSEIKPASPGISGFVGDNFRVTFHVKVEDSDRKVNVFVKSLPLSNKPKAKFIDEHNFYRREMIMFRLFEKMQAAGDKASDDSNPWCTRAYICTDSIVVMPDLLYQGYRQCPPLDCLDLKHILLTAASIARFHAAFANYETKRSLNGHMPFKQKFADLLNDPTFSDSPWLRAAAKLTKNFLTAFSENCSTYPVNLEEILVKLYIESSETLTESDSFNVVIHKDLWINNIMFKYEADGPINALLIDFQCIRYGPPAFDPMIFLYLNTSRSFRERYDSVIFRNYFVTFLENVTDTTKGRLQHLGYDFNNFVGWCKRARMFGMLVTMAIFPYTLMDPALAQKTFDDPMTFTKHCDVDRTEPVVAHARECARYRQRQLEVSEEFVERYVLKRLPFGSAN